MTTTVRPLLAAVAAALVLPGLAACGNSKPSASEVRSKIIEKAGTSKATSFNLTVDPDGVIGARAEMAKGSPSTEYELSSSGDGAVVDTGQTGPPVDQAAAFDLAALDLAALVRDGLAYATAKCSAPETTYPDSVILRVGALVPGKQITTMSCFGNDKVAPAASVEGQPVEFADPADPKLAARFFALLEAYGDGSVGFVQITRTNGADLRMSWTAAAAAPGSMGYGAPCHPDLIWSGPSKGGTFVGAPLEAGCGTKPLGYSNPKLKLAALKPEGLAKIIARLGDDYYIQLNQASDTQQMWSGGPTNGEPQYYDLDGNLLTK